MSIASDYAAKMAQQLDLRRPGFGMSAWVRGDGSLQLEDERLTPAEALKLAEWIQRTFGEPAPKTTPCPDCGAVDWQQDEHSYGCRACGKVLGRP